MIIIRQILSLDESDLRPYRTLRQTMEHYRQGIFIAEGDKVVQRLIESAFTVISVLMTPEWFEKCRLRMEQRAETITVYVASNELLSSIVGYKLHQGIMGLGKIPEKKSLPEILSSSQQPYLCVAVDGITYSENMGVIIRNCTGLGAQALIVSERSSSPYLRRSVRNSMGTIFQLPIIEGVPFIETLNMLHIEYHTTVIAAHPHSNGTSMHDYNYTGNTCILLGSEGNGLTPELLTAFPHHAEIPMHAGTDSLNVASACAIFLAEVERQRRQA